MTKALAGWVLGATLLKASVGFAGADSFMTQGIHPWSAIGRFEKVNALGVVVAACTASLIWSNLLLSAATSTGLVVKPTALISRFPQMQKEAAEKLKNRVWISVCNATAFDSEVAISFTLAQEDRSDNRSWLSFPAGYCTFIPSHPLNEVWVHARRKDTGQRLALQVLKTNRPTPPAEGEICVRKDGSYSGPSTPCFAKDPGFVALAAENVGTPDIGAPHVVAVYLTEPHAPPLLEPPVRFAEADTEYPFLAPDSVLKGSH